MNAALIDLTDAGQCSALLVGGKARNLGLMHGLGLPVPAGLVISAPSLRNGFTAALQQDLVDDLERRGWLELPLAVRSSAPQEDSGELSFAGIYHSALNVVGPQAVIAAVEAVLASLWTPQAAGYRDHHGIVDASMAVVVMPMVKARAAGIGFTCDPRSGRDDRIVINGVLGLADMLVGGHENGEEIVIAEDLRSEVLQVQERRPAGDAVVLNDRQAVELAALMRDAAQALNYADPAFDMEWVYDGARFWLVQARPVTARVWRAYDGLAGQQAIWTNGNTRDVVPHVMGAMDWITWRRVADIMLERGYRLAGFPLLPGVRRTALIRGRLYLNAAFLQWEAYDALGVSPSVINSLLGGHHPEISVPPPSLVQRLSRMRRLLRFIVRSGAERRLGHVQIAEAFAQCAEWRRQDCSVWDDSTLIARLNELSDVIRSQESMMFLQGSGGGNLYLLLDLVGSVLPGRKHALVAAIMAGGTPSVTAQQAYELHDMARSAAADPVARAFLEDGAPWDLDRLPKDHPFRQSFMAFIERYGHRGVYESYVTSQRYRENPACLLDQMAGLMHVDPEQRRRRQTIQEKQGWDVLRNALSPVKLWRVKMLTRIARREVNDRELARSALVAFGEVNRLWWLEVGRRLQSRGMLNLPEDVFDLTKYEALSALSGGLGAEAVRSRCAHRRRQRKEWDRQDAPEVIIGHRAQPVVTVKPHSMDGWIGVAVGSGVATGPVRVVMSPDKGAALLPGEIMAAPSTDPAWVPLFLRASGLVIETGGYLSHGAIVARELGIPAVVNLPGILNTLTDGQILRVDGLAGRVQAQESMF